MQLDGKQMHRVSIGGKLNFSALPSDVQQAVKARLASKDPMMGNAFEAGALPGIKIDGKVVTRDNIKDFEVKAKKTEQASAKPKSPERRYSKKDLEALDFKDLKVIGKKFGTTDRSKKNLISEILKLQ